MSNDTKGLAKLYICNSTHTQPFYSSLDYVQDNPSEPVK